MINTIKKAKKGMRSIKTEVDTFFGEGGAVLGLELLGRLCTT
jgi:hypothetical protein